MAVSTNDLQKFDPTKHLSKVKGGADYLEVKWRIFWFRDLAPKGQISTSVILLDIEKGIAVFKAVVEDGQGGHAEGHGSETIRDFTDFIEKAETKAIGRALAALGYGTQFAPELEEGSRIADSPVSKNTSTLSPVNALYDRAKTVKAFTVTGDKTANGVAFLAWAGKTLKVTISKQSDLTPAYIATLEKHLDSIAKPQAVEAAS